MSLPELIKDLSRNGMLDIDAIDASIELMKIESLRERLKDGKISKKELETVLVASEKLPSQERIMYYTMDNFSNREKQCYLMHSVEGKSMQKIADELGITKTSVNQYIRRAREKIANNLQQI